jgi:hypothetical protein
MDKLRRKNKRILDLKGGVNPRLLVIEIVIAIANETRKPRD